MPKIEIDYETLDGIVVAGLREMLSTMIECYRGAKHEQDRRAYAKDIKALEHVIGIYT